MASYYNEIDPFCAQWLRELIADGLIAPGDVDERDIREVTPDDVRGYRQCHFFAGIGGWSYALRLAGWDDARPVWTGSCPCQPFSVAGNGKGASDERHLWPEFYRLVRECRPTIVFGEQVKGAIRHGWLDGISADLEAAGYAVGAHVLGAHSVGAPHIRQRLYWVADSDGRNTGTERQQRRGEQRQQPQDCGAVWLADTDCGAGVQGSSLARGRNPRGNAQPRSGFGGHGEDCGMGHTGSARAGRNSGAASCAQGEGTSQRLADGHEGSNGPVITGAAGFWSDFDTIPCADRKARRVEPGIQPLAHGFPNRVGTLRGAGNAIVPQIAAEFIKACNL